MKPKLFLFFEAINRLHKYDTKEGFKLAPLRINEPLIRYRIHTFQACAFDRSIKVFEISKEIFDFDCSSNRPAINTTPQKRSDFG